MFCDGEIKHQGKICDRGEARANAQKSHTGVEDALAEQHAANNDHNKPEQGAGVAELRDGALPDASLQQTRDNDRVLRTLDALRTAARGRENTMPPLLDCVRAYATVGEMCDALREVWGEYEEVPVI